MPERRQLHFNSLDDVLTEAEGLLKCGYQHAGNWSLGTMGDHLGRALIYSCEGFPKTWPRPIQWVARRLVLRRILGRKTFRWRVPAPISVNRKATDEEGVAFLSRGIEQFQEPGSLLFPHIVFGEFTREEWLQFHLWHCEHHFSFLIPASDQLK